MACQTRLFSCFRWPFDSLYNNLEHILLLFWFICCRVAFLRVAIEKTNFEFLAKFYFQCCFFCLLARQANERPSTSREPFSNCVLRTANCSRQLPVVDCARKKNWFAVVSRSATLPMHRYAAMLSANMFELPAIKFPSIIFWHCWLWPARILYAILVNNVRKLQTISTAMHKTIILNLSVECGINYIYISYFGKNKLTQ